MGLTWQGTPQQIADRIKEWLQAVLHGVVYLCADYARRMEQFAKSNRPWTDRTSNARQGLIGRVRTLGEGHVQATISHTVEYGIYLEARNYKIIVPTLNANKGPFWSDFVHMVFRFNN